MILPGLMGVRLYMAIAGALVSEVEDAPQAVRTAGVSGAAATLVVAGSAIDRRPEEPELQRILERLALRSREIRTVQVMYKLERISRKWGDTKDGGAYRLVLDRGKFGVIDSLESRKPDGERARTVGLWTRESFTYISLGDKFGYRFPCETDDDAWLPSDLKLPLFFDTTVAEMTQAYRFTLDKSAQTTYTLRLTPRAGRTGSNYWAAGGLVLDQKTLLPTTFWLNDGHGEVDVFRSGYQDQRTDPRRYPRGRGWICLERIHARGCRSTALNAPMVARSRQSGRTGAADSLGVRRFERGIGLTAEVGGLSSRPNHGLTTVVTWFFRVALMWGIGRPSVKRRAGSETRPTATGGVGGAVPDAEVPSRSEGRHCGWGTRSAADVMGFRLRISLAGGFLFGHELLD